MAHLLQLNHDRDVYMEQASNKIKELWKCQKEHKDKAVKLLMKILTNIQLHPNDPKYTDVNFAKMMKVFRNARPALHILFAAGFKQTVDGERIQIKPQSFK